MLVLGCYLVGACAIIWPLLGVVATALPLGTERSAEVFAGETLVIYQVGDN